MSRYLPSGSGRDYFIVADELQRFGRRDKSIHDLFPNPQEARVWKEASSSSMSEISGAANGALSGSFTNKSDYSGSRVAEKYVAGYAGYVPKGAVDPIGVSTTTAFVAGRDCEVKPNEKQTYLKTFYGRGNTEDSPDSTSQTSALDGTTRLQEVKKNEDAYRAPIAGYTGYRPRFVRNHDDKN
eukprot:ANDGO_06489.mRNA.1 hypothetical protein